jgi:cytochrome c553
MKSSLKLLALATLALSVPAIAGAADAAENWKTMCAKCHGANGEGKKPMKTKDYTDPAVQAQYTDTQLFDDTKNGVKDTKMPAFAEKLSDDDINALVALIRTFKKG